MRSRCQQRYVDHHYPSNKSYLCSWFDTRKAHEVSNSSAVYVPKRNLRFLELLCQRHSLSLDSSSFVVAPECVHAVQASCAVLGVFFSLRLELSFQLKGMLRQELLFIQMGEFKRGLSHLQVP